jgi:hypothetical protein
MLITISTISLGFIGFPHRMKAPAALAFIATLSSQGVFESALQLRAI